MSLTKVVNGERYIISPEEELKVRDEWTKEDAKVQLYIDTLKYKDDRKKEYPDIGEQLDAILKTLNYMQLDGQTDLVKDLDGIIGKWLAVKAKYPKPTE